MKMVPRSYPHPVLSSVSDDVMPNRFDFDLGISSDRTNYYLKISISHENQTVNEMIKAGNAQYGIHVECRRNFYRRLFCYASSTINLEIPARSLLGTVEVSCFVLASKEITGYKIAGMHRDYVGAKLQIRAGDYLAVADSKSFEAYLDYDPIKKISSIMDVRCSSTLESGPTVIDLTSDRIIAELSKDDFSRYTQLKASPDLIPLLANQIVVPALIEAMETIRVTRAESEKYDDYMNLRWFRSIRKRLQDLKN